MHFSMLNVINTINVSTFNTNILSTNIFSINTLSNKWIWLQTTWKILKITFFYVSIRKLSYKLILPLDNFYNSIIKIMKLLLNIPEISINRFIFYHSYYKKKIFSNLTWTFFYTRNCFYFLYNLSSLSIAFLFTYDSKVSIIELKLLIKKKDYQELFYIFFFILFNLCFLFLAWQSLNLYWYLNSNLA